MSAEKLLGIRSLKRRFPGHDFVHRDPEAVIVGSGSQNLAENLLGRHIGPRPLNQRLTTIHELAESTNHLLSQREIDQPEIGRPIEQKIIRLHVPVDIFFRMHMPQRQAGKFDEPLDPGLNRDDINLDHLLDVWRLEQLHHEEAVFLLHDDFLETHDVRMIERLENGRLVLEGNPVILVLECLREDHLDRILLRAPFLGCFPDLSCLAGCNAAMQLVIPECDACL